VVAATELSTPARRAIERVGRPAAAAGASLMLVHAVNGSVVDELRRWVESTAV